MVTLSLANKHTSQVELRVGVRRDGHDRADTQSVSLDQDDLCCERDLTWDDVRLSSTAKLTLNLATQDPDAVVTGSVSVTMVATAP